MILKFSFFQRLIVIELLVSETIEKKLSKLLLPKTFFFPTFSEKRLLIKISQNSKEKPDKSKKLQSFPGFSAFFRKVLQQLFFRGMRYTGMRL